MDPVALATLLKDYGPWGFCALLILTLRWLFGKYDACQECRIADGRTQTIALQAAADAVKESNRLLGEQEARLNLLADRLGRGAPL